MAEVNKKHLVITSEFIDVMLNRWGVKINNVDIDKLIRDNMEHADDNYTPFKARVRIEIEELVPRAEILTVENRSRAVNDEDQFDIIPEAEADAVLEALKH